MAGRILVEERREERRAELADPALAVDERDLAETCGAVVERCAPAEDLSVLVRVDLDRAAALEADAQAVDHGAADIERLRGAHDALGALRIGGREDLFCRQVRHVLDARPRPRAGAFAREARGGEEADRQVRARPLEVQCVEPERVETGAGLVELVGARAPRRGRIVVVQPADVDELLPQLRDGVRV